MLKRIGTALVAVTMALALFGGAAYADDDAGIGGGGIDLGADDGGDNGNSGGEHNDDVSTGGGAEECTATSLECAYIPPIVPPGTPTPTRPVAGQLAQTAVGRLDLHTPQIRMSPEPPVPALVRLQTWFWLDANGWGNDSESVTAGNTTVTATVKPVSVIWETGEGTKICNGPGREWRKGLGQNATTDCGFTYKHTSASQPGGKYTVRTIVRYSASWECTGDCSSNGGNLGLIDSPAAVNQLRVTERQSVNE